MEQRIRERRRRENEISEREQYEVLRTKSQALSLLHQLTKILRGGAIMTVLACQRHQTITLQQNKRHKKKRDVGKAATPDGGNSK
jgi:hypothetical protein